MKAIKFIAIFVLVALYGFTAVGLVMFSGAAAWFFWNEYFGTIGGYVAGFAQACLGLAMIGAAIWWLEYSEID